MSSCLKIDAVILLLTVCWLKQVTPLIYRELESSGVSCYPRDSCHRRFFPTQENAGKNTCECDATCSRRGTCCIDSPYVYFRPSTRTEICGDIAKVGHHYYFNETGGGYFFQVTKCPRLWNGPVQVKKLCEMKDPVDGVDFMVAVPVTNTYSGLTYNNYFCALCNNDIEGSVLWDVGLYDEVYNPISDRFNVQDSGELPDSDAVGDAATCDGRNVLELSWNTEGRSYGYWDNCSYDSPRFFPLNIVLAIPKDVETFVKGCRSGVISQCPSGWKDNTVRLKCGAYFGMIKDPGTVEDGGWFRSHKYYRNVHCAICNGVTNFEGFSCESLSPGVLISTETYPTSLTVLFGHLLSNKGCLGDNEKYVKGLGCRAVLCANPRHKVKNGKCTSQ